MNCFLKIFNFIVGTCLASHACVIVDRAGKENFIFSRSKCANCNQQLSLLDEIPLLSYLFLKGRCRYCKIHIPAEYFITEFLGGFAFYRINFSNIHDISTAIILFSLLLAAISDFQRKEFDVVFIFPALFISILNLMEHLQKISVDDLIQFCPIFLFFLYETFRNKFGSGDLIVYLILSLYFNPRFANLTFLIASVLLIIFFICGEIGKKKRVAFIPFIYIGIIIQLLSK